MPSKVDFLKEFRTFKGANDVLKLMKLKLKMT